MDSLANRLKSIRQQRGLSARELATSAGLSHATVAAIEARGAGAGTGTIVKLAQVLGVDLTWLLTGTGSPFADEEQASTPNQAA